MGLLLPFIHFMEHELVEGKSEVMKLTQMSKTIDDWFDFLHG